MTVASNNNPGLIAPSEEVLQAPYRFDTAIGYWTGDLDTELLSRALETIPPDLDVERLVTDTEVRLRGPKAAVQMQARLLRAMGLR